MSSRDQDPDATSVTLTLMLYRDGVPDGRFFLPAVFHWMIPWRELGIVIAGESVLPFVFPPKPSLVVDQLSSSALSMKLLGRNELVAESHLFTEAAMFIFAAPWASGI